MERVRINPENRKDWLEMRAKDLTSTEVSALFGINPYMTKAELWYSKKDPVIIDEEKNEYTTWGQRLQDSIAEGIAKDNGYTVRKKDEYVRIPKLRLGASYDYEITGLGQDSYSPAEPVRWNFEIKNVHGLKYSSDWVVDGKDVTAPLYMEMQVQHQMLVDDMDRTQLAALISGNTVVRVERVASLSIQEAIIREADKFWESIENNNPPPFDFERDTALIGRLFSTAVEGKVYDATKDAVMSKLAKDYACLSYTIKEASEEREKVKNEIMLMLADYSKVVGSDFSISCGQIKDSKVEAHTRKGYRNFKVYRKDKK